VQLFLDTANIVEIEKAASWGVIRGVTTNPSLVSREGVGDFTSLLQRICSLVDGPISAEVLAEESDAMVQEALALAAVNMEQIVIKLPLTAEALQAMHILKGKGVRTNATLVFSAPQAMLAAAAGASFVSPFVGRLDDIGHNGIATLGEIAEIFSLHGIETKIIAASIRHPQHVVEAAKAGAHIATVPLRVLQQMLLHPLTTSGIIQFQQDWAKLK